MSDKSHESQSEEEMQLLQTETEIDIEGNNESSFFFSCILCMSVTIFMICVLIGFVTIAVGLSKGKPKKYVIFLSDIHYDHKYVENGSPNEKCRNSTNSPISFPYGQYNCDTPRKLLDSLYKFLPVAAPKPRLIVFGGDLSSSSATSESFDVVLKNMENFKANMKKLYPNTPILFTLGNREYPSNFGNFSTDEETFEKIYKIFEDDIHTTDASDIFKKTGSYYIDLPTYHLRFISFNTAIYSKGRDSTEEKDPHGQFKWLENALDTKFKTIVVFHMQPGIAFAGKRSAWKQQYIEKLGSVFSLHSPTYALGAHIHLDMMMPMFGTNVIALSNPAVSPRHGNNPAFRKYYIDRHGLMNNYDQYYADILNGTAELEWKLEYSFSKEYKKGDLSKVALNDVISEIKKNPKKYWTFREHLFARATENSAFYKCIITSKTEESFDECIHNLQ